LGAIPVPINLRASLAVEFDSYSTNRFCAARHPLVTLERRHYITRFQRPSHKDGGMAGREGRLSLVATSAAEDVYANWISDDLSSSPLDAC